MQVRAGFRSKFDSQASRLRFDGEPRQAIAAGAAPYKKRGPQQQPARLPSENGRCKVRSLEHLMKRKSRAIKGAAET